MAERHEDIRADVLDLLQKFRGVEPLKKLFWGHLNYDRVNKPTTRRGWPSAAAEVLADDPTLLASGGQSGDFNVLYARLAKDRLSLADERIVTSRLLKDHPYGLFVFSDRTQTNWHFLNVKMAEEEEKRKLFRRITVGPNEKMRTACQVISQLDLSTINQNLFGLSPLVIQERHDQAFDVEPVTEEFFRQYHATFTKVEDLIRGIRDKDRKRLYTQRLFNRLMFIAFIQKKGWLQFGGKKNPDYLAALWADYRKNGDRNMGFYHERLYNLFFHGLGAQDDVGIININRGGVFKDVIGTVPYLNGGLFEEDEDDKDGSIKVPDDAIRAVLQDLFDHFNFTVTEATPLDVEVAVDPEMLGKVFEELVTGRHETGSYYTPKPIVSFMCREALKGYLESNAPKEKPETIAKFVDEHEPSILRDAEAVLEALRRVRTCDPACGSGAYLLGMMHELMALRTCLFSAKKVDPISAYDRKLEIIQRNVYGVDLDPFAVNIARLRLWLSLAVEFDGDNPPPLPNLKFEIEEGDSLGATGPQPHQMLMWEKEIQEFSDTKAKYIKAHGEAKRSLEQKVVALKQSISSWTHHGLKVEGFDWPVEFADVFADGGFDIAVANPPYVRQEIIKDLKPTLKRVFPEVFSGTADLYVYFYARALEILKEKGMLAFISSNKWIRANYGKELRRHLAETTSIVSITDFGELPVFKSAATFPMILICSKGNVNTAQSLRFTQVKSLALPYPDLVALIQQSGSLLPTAAVRGSKWLLASSSTQTLIQEMQRKGTPLGELVRERIYWGIKTGYNEAFYLDDAERNALVSKDKHSAEVIRPLAVGDDVRRWRIEDRHRWIILTKIGTDMKRYPAIFQHLKRYQQELESRYDKGDHWWELRSCDYYDVMEGRKIIYPEIGKEPRFTLDCEGRIVNNKVFAIPSEDPFLLGVLNSSAVWFFLKNTCSILGDADAGGRLELRTIYMRQVPIPSASSAERTAIGNIVKSCLRKEGVDCEKEEGEINQRVAALYGIDATDIAEHWPTQSKRRKARA